MAETKEGERVRPFSCGSQYAAWSDANCCRCRKGGDDGLGVGCPISDALSEASIRDGTVSAEVGRRMALPLTAPAPYVWPCGELEARHG